ncbi:MAG TPA: sigma-70 family RNA polymerase sigma factor [Solirubrobacterales bacterium]|nr:sigma-70 family RNA polymerase sigma factor [Solirubrobacterales bacterium]
MQGELGGKLSQGEQTTKASAAARKRAAVEMIARYEAALRRTARRYSLDAEDAEDAYQRALEIALTKAPTTDLRELIRWTQTVTKHEALAVRQSREKLLGYRRTREGAAEDPVALIPYRGDGPDEQAERREEIARSREALQALKPAELRALGLLAEGYSYAEIGEQTGYSQTKINRLLAEGRARYRAIVSSSEDGSRCRDLQPLLSAFCDGEAGPREAIEVQEHLRACATCRATMRTYRTAPRMAAAMLPLLPPSRSLLERAQELAANLGARLPGFGGGESMATQVAVAGGSRGAGMAAIAKLLTVCAGAAGGAAACVATGVLPAPAFVNDPDPKPAIERPAVDATAASEDEAVDYQPAPPQAEAPPSKPVHQPAVKEEASPVNVEPSAATAGAVEYEAPAPESSSSVEAAPAPSPSGSAAGEFGP